LPTLLDPIPEALVLHTLPGPTHEVLIHRSEAQAYLGLGPRLAPRLAQLLP